MRTNFNEGRTKETISKVINPERHPEKCTLFENT